MLVKASSIVAFFVIFCAFLGASGKLYSQAHGGANHDQPTESPCGHTDTYDAAGVILHHIADANEFHLWGHLAIPLPVMLYAPDHGWTLGLSSMFEHGHKAVNGYVLNHGRVNRVEDASFAYFEEKVAVQCISHDVVETSEGKKKDVYFAIFEDGGKYLLDAPSVWDGGLLGGGVTSFYDFSITKNVFTMLLASLLLMLLWTSVARAYKKRDGLAPKANSAQGFMEPFFNFIKDEITLPMIGEKHYARFHPFILTVFFFILFCNLFGLIPFFPGSSNVTGNIAVTFTLALIAAIVAYANGNRHFWEHTLWMPGVPPLIKIYILTPVEILGLVIKPFSLMVRLFANITAGHIIILSLISLIFIFGKNGASLGGASAGAFVGSLFTAFMNCIELLVAFVQAFIFAILSASYIGAAVEEGHHHDDHQSDLQGAH